MNKLSMIALLTLTIQSSALAYNMRDVAGKYQITSQDIPVLNVVTLNLSGSLKFVEKTFEGNTTCSGKWWMVNDLITASIRCPDGGTFSERINIAGVKNLKSFKAVVSSSLYNLDLEMNFVRMK